jgi:hypothetical protein
MSGSIRGKVFSPEHTPLKDVRVSLRGVRVAEVPWFDQKTDENGSYDISGVIPGEYHLIIHHELFKRQMSKVSFPIEDSRLERNIQLEQGKSITGRLIDSTGAPVGGVNIIAGNECLSTSQTREDGTFTVHGLGDGTAKVSTLSLNHALAFAMADPGTTDLRIQLGHASLKVLMEWDSPPSDYSFILRKLGTSEEQSFDTEYAEPTSRIELRGLHSGTYEVEISANGYHADDRPRFTVTPTSTVHTVHLRFRRANAPA